MPQITCPHCHQPYAITPEQWPQYQGKRINCTKCNQPFDVIDSSLPPLAPPPMPAAAPAGYAQGGFGPAGVTPPTKKGMSGGMIALLVCGIAVVLFVGCGGLLTAILLPSLGRAREQANRIKSGNNLRQIGLAAMMYANQNQNHFPDDEKMILKTQEIDLDVFISPRTKTAKPALSDVDQMGDWANAHSDYQWVGAGLTESAGTDTVLAYEKPDGVTEGIEVLFADSHIEWVPMTKAQAMITNLKQGKNPPPSLSPLSSAP